jgi:hypothetical protein
MRFDKRKSVLSPEALESLPELAPLTAQQKTFVLLIAGGAPIVAAVKGAYTCKNPRSAKSFAYDLMNRRTMQPVLNRLFGLKDDNKAEFLKRVDALMRRGSRVTDAEVNALVLYGVANDFLPPDYSPTAELAKLGKV